MGTGFHTSGDATEFGRATARWLRLSHLGDSITCQELLRELGLRSLL